jgi:CBS domain-containing protein
VCRPHLIHLVARVQSPVHDLLILSSIGIKPDERVEQALVRFAQTADREFAVEDREGRLIGTLALLDLNACGGSGR